MKGERMQNIPDEKIYKEYQGVMSKIITRTIPIIKNSYEGLDAIDLLMNLPVRPVFEEFDDSDLKKKDLEKVILGGYITRDSEFGNPDRMVVFLVFRKPRSMTSWDKYFNMFIHGQNAKRYVNNLAMIYLHEALHLLNRHYDFYLNEKYKSFVLQKNSKMPEETIHQILNMAFDFWINSFILEEASNNSIIDGFRKDNDTFFGLYDPHLSHSKMTQMEILESLLDEAEISSQKIYAAPQGESGDGDSSGGEDESEDGDSSGEESEDGEGQNQGKGEGQNQGEGEGEEIGELVTVDIHGQQLNVFYDKRQHVDPSKNEKDDKSAEESLAKAMDSAREAMLNKLKGSGSQTMLQKLGVPIEVPIDWFKELKGSVFTMVQKYAPKRTQTWSKLKSKYRHISPMPGNFHYENKMIALISIDQSGSMSDEDLKKINYVLIELQKYAQEFIILKHDDEISDITTLKGSEKVKLQDYLQKREKCGGTSHKEVFAKIKELKTSKKYRQNKFIYLSFSDNYSDIERVYDPNLFHDITSYWIMTSGGRPLEGIPGMQISLEQGLIQK